MSDETAPTAVVRRLGREYGWLLAAVGLAALVLLCSLPFVDGVGMSWNSGDPFAAPAKVAPPAGGATPEPTGPPSSAAPTATASPSPTASPASAQRRPAARTTSPTPKRTTAPPAAAAPKAPVALGPDGAVELWQMLRDYCRDTYRTGEAQLRHGTGQAEGNWECRREGPDPLIDMNAACRAEYGSTAFAQFSNRADAFSWRCFRR